MVGEPLQAEPVCASACWALLGGLEEPNPFCLIPPSLRPPLQGLETQP